MDKSGVKKQMYRTNQLVSVPKEVESWTFLDDILWLFRYRTVAMINRRYLHNAWKQNKNMRKTVSQYVKGRISRSNHNSLICHDDTLAQLLRLPYIDKKLKNQIMHSLIEAGFYIFIDPSDTILVSVSVERCCQDRYKDYELYFPE